MKIRFLCLFAIIAFGVPAFALHHDEYPVLMPPLSEGIFPCSNCHAGLEVNAKKRELKDEHTNIKLHMPKIIAGVLIATILPTGIN